VYRSRTDDLPALLRDALALGGVFSFLTVWVGLDEHPDVVFRFFGLDLFFHCHGAGPVFEFSDKGQCPIAGPEVFSDDVLGKSFFRVYRLADVKPVLGW